MKSIKLLLQLVIFVIIGQLVALSWEYFFNDNLQISMLFGSITGFLTTTYLKFKQKKTI